MLGVLGLIVSLGFIIYSVYKGWHIIPVSLIGGLFAALTNGMEIWPAFSENYATGLGNYVGTYFLIFVLGALFGELMSETGSAKSVSYKLMDIMGAKRAPLALVLATLVLTYGGINSFIVVFTLYPISVILFNEAKLPRRILVTCVFLGVATITQSSLPGTPSIQNLIPANYFNTSTTAAPLIGIVASLLFFILGMAYINKQIKIAKANGEVFVPIEEDNLNKNSDIDPREGLPDWKIAILPIVVVILIILLLNEKVPALFAVVIGLTTAIILTYLLNWKNIEEPILIMTKGCTAGVMPLLNTAAIVAYGSIVQASPAFQEFIDLAMSLQFNPYLTGAIGVNIIAGITGSSSGGLTIFLNNMGDYLLKLGANPEALHRVLSIASGGLDTLPHNGAVVTILSVLGSTHKESYKDVAVVCVILPMFVTIISVIMAVFLY